MPRDKTLSHKKVLQAAKEEFMRAGFEKASIRNIGAAAGLTSAALYRHCTDKEDLFCQVVEPAITALQEWEDAHISGAYRSVNEGDYEGITSQSEIDMIRTVALPHQDLFRLLVSGSAGTRYENFIHDLVKEQEEKMKEGLRFLKDKGYPVKEVDPEELHILNSAYTTALFEPVIHGFDPENVDHYLNTIERFFMPGWHEILGI